MEKLSQFTVQQWVCKCAESPHERSIHSDDSQDEPPLGASRSLRHSLTISVIYEEAAQRWSEFMKEITRVGRTCVQRKECGPKSLRCVCFNTSGSDVVERASGKVMHKASCTTPQKAEGGSSPCLGGDCQRGHRQGHRASRTP